MPGRALLLAACALLGSSRTAVGSRLASAAAVEADNTRQPAGAVSDASQHARTQHSRRISQHHTAQLARHGSAWRSSCAAGGASAQGAGAKEQAARALGEQAGSATHATYRVRAVLQHRRATRAALLPYGRAEPPAPRSHGLQQQRPARSTPARTHSTGPPHASASPHDSTARAACGGSSSIRARTEAALDAFEVANTQREAGESGAHAGRRQHACNAPCRGRPCRDGSGPRR